MAGQTGPGHRCRGARDGLLHTQRRPRARRFAAGGQPDHRVDRIRTPSSRRLGRCRRRRCADPTITAKTGSYGPKNIEAVSGIPTTLVVKTNRTQGCIRSMVVPSLGITAMLPTSGETRIDVGTLQPGRLDYTCGMGMYSGMITIL
ncbi:cupredoxin domain-containing protein [Nocardia farcinica]|uniref:cupredoxin domain-containing protein n=1 Tax=Nocardia farcinica TaxID=37329 RepID=UPI001E306DD8|nr:cupredoxin domain-containing protein [Nocardia farcinica]UEX25815.1 cupredoxin domain-containing protein [Nocardia farcinica]